MDYKYVFLEMECCVFSKLKIRKRSLASLYSREADGSAMCDFRTVVFASKRESAYTDP